MRRESYKILLFSILMAVLFLARTQPALAQEKASDWFERGLNATNPDSRIAAFERAIALEPDYVEAYFYLGLAYKQKNMLSEAELTLHKAYFKNPYALTNEIKTRILFELGVVKSNLSKTVEALDSFKGAKAIVGTNNAIKGRILYELGLAYIRNGDYQLALTELREGRELIPQSSDLFNKAIAEAEANIDVLKNYNNGLTFLNNGRYQQAVRQFELVIQQDANFKDVQARLNEAKRNLSESNTNKQINDVYEQALSAKVKDNNDLALRLFRQVAEDDPNFRDVANQIRELQNRQPVTTPQRANAESDNDAIERLYARASTEFANGNLRGSINTLQRVKAIQSNYKDVDRLIANAQNELNRRAEEEQRVENLYNEGLSFLANKEWSNALGRFRAVQQLTPGYKEVEQKVFELKQAVTAEKQFLTSVDSLYRSGILAFQERDWLNALLTFEKIETIKPGYRDVVSKLQEAKSSLNSTGKEKDSLSGIALITSLVFLALVIPAGAVFIFSPTLKARMYLLKGDYNNAALILEQIIEKRPEKVRLYPLLAHIYLLEDRQDETALKTYERILKLNIMTPKRAQINSIVANHYLKSGKKDSNAIDIMEKELTYKLNKLQSGTAS